MPTERVLRQIELVLDQIEAARVRGEWGAVVELAGEILDLDPENADAAAFLAAAGRREQRLGDDPAGTASAPSEQPQATVGPASFAGGRYEVRRFLGEGGKKLVYLAYDSLLDRDVAFALIKTDGLDETGRERVRREAQAMGRLGAHPHIVSVFDLGEEAGQPFVVTELMGGGDVEGLIERAPDGRLALDRVLQIGLETCRGLEFAHSQGIVHRDLKPGNVWLTADGRAKIGDFGLAVAVDRTRLTQAGVMVGTVLYMPPEQATGGEVGPHSDLYSLGAMLYEMVCGRPPFVGDESVAIIGQHLNTPPVAPSWHRPDCPPALEALIFDLLHKNPAARPGSAAAVRETLAQVELESAGETATEARGGIAAVAASPIYGRTFVGRESELQQLKDAFDAMLSGRGGLVMVVGEPGIGKTAVCEQLATYSVLRGGQTLVGHCYEEGSLSQPYLPFVEAMRSYVLARDTDRLRSDLGSGAADVARIVSEVGDRLQVALRPSGAADDDQWRLLEAITGFLRNASADRPLVVVLEDLHWADRGSLDLLQHLVRNLEGSRLLVIGTYRDVEVERTHPLSGALAELRRSSTFTRLALRGLGVDEVHRMINAVAGQEVRATLADAVHRQTEGNPLFVQEVVRLIAEEGLVRREGGRWQVAGDTLPETRIPEGLRDVIGKRLSHLSAGTNQLLAIAAVVGRDFDLAVLRVVAALDEEALLTAIEEAVRVGVLEERAQTGRVRYRFAHAFFRQTLYEEIIAPRRLRLHQQVARALEVQYAGRLDEHAAELAEHFSQSTDHDDLAKAVNYGELAARRAMSVFAYSEAASHLERCLAVQDVLNPGDEVKRVELLLAFGAALLDAGEPRRVLDDIAPAAVTLAQARGDRGLGSRVCTMALRAFFEAAGPVDFGTPEAARWLELADSLAPHASPARVLTDIGLARAAQARMLTLSEGWQHSNGVDRKLLTRARDVAHSLGDPALSFQANFAWLDIVKGPQYLAQRLQIADELAASLDDLSPRDAAWGCFWLVDVYFCAGSRERAEAFSERLAELAGRSKQPVSMMLAIYLQSQWATCDGRLDQATATRNRAIELGDETGLSELPRVGDYFFFLQTRRYLGTTLDPERLPAAMAPSARTLTYFGEVHPELGADLDRIAAERAELDDSDDEVYTWFDAAVMQAAALAHHSATARLFLRRYQSTQYVTLGITSPVCTARLLGDAAAIVGDRTSARGHYEQAREVCTRMRLRAEGALAALGLAEVLITGDASERAESQPHLDFAIAELQEMRMQPALQRALANKELLKA